MDLCRGGVFPRANFLDGTRHHLITFGKPARLDRLRTRWDKLVAIVDASAAQFDAAAAGVADGSAILVRPDGFVGFRDDPADDATMEALETHLASYLIPNSAAPKSRFGSDIT